MIETPKEKRKFVILYEKYKYLIQKVAMDVLHDSFLAEDAVHNAFVSVANLAPVYTLYSQKIYLWRIFGRYFYIGYGRSKCGRGVSPD